MTSSRQLLLLGPAGILLAFVSAVLEPSVAGDASAAKVLSTFDGSASVLSAFLGVAGAMLIAVFVPVACERLREGGASGPFLGVAVAGGGVLVVGFALNGAVRLALGAASDDKNAAAASTLNLFTQELFLPLVAGVGLIVLGLGAASLAARVLPRWFGIAGIVLGVLAPLGPAGFATFVLGAIWILLAGMLLHRAPGRAPTGARRDGAPLAA